MNKNSKKLFMLHLFDCFVDPVVQIYSTEDIPDDALINVLHYLPLEDVAQVPEISTRFKRVLVA